jgi:hypothetical protein
MNETDALPPQIRKSHNKINLSLRQDQRAALGQIQDNRTNRSEETIHIRILHPLPRIHLRGSSLPRHRATTSRPRMKPPTQKDASPDITRREERATFPEVDRGAEGTRRRQP